MRILAEVLKIIGALGIASILGYPVIFPPAGPGLWFFLLTFVWPLAFAPILLWIRPGPIAILLRVVEIPLWGWTAFMTLFAAGMDRSAASYILVAGAALYGLGAFIADVIAVRSQKPRPA
jgi:hypothetical protein